MGAGGEHLVVGADEDGLDAGRTEFDAESGVGGGDGGAGSVRMGAPWVFIDEAGAWNALTVTLSRTLRRGPATTYRTPCTIYANSRLIHGAVAPSAWCSHSPIFLFNSPFQLTFRGYRLRVVTVEEDACLRHVLHAPSSSIPRSMPASRPSLSGRENEVVLHDRRQSSQRSKRSSSPTHYRRNSRTFVAAEPHQ